MITLLKAGVLTVSDRSFRGEREDRSGALLKELAEELPANVLYRLVPDEKKMICDALLDMIDNFQCELIVTTGGTGLAPRDITPEATREILDREVPGIAEALRAAGMQKKPAAMLSRGIAGVRGTCLIVNLPGSPKAVEEGFHVLQPILRHAIELLKGEISDCQKSSFSLH